MKEKILKGELSFLKTNPKKGISLIMLIITIVIIIILAGAVILTISNSDIISKANEAVEAQLRSNVIEVAYMIKVDYELNEVLGKPTTEITLEVIEQSLGKELPAEYTMENGILKYGDEIIFDLSNENNGSTTYENNGSTTWVYTEGELTAKIPKGFTMSEVDSEDTIAEGLVIYEGTEVVNESNHATALTTRNQFVWIPVKNGIMKRKDWDKGLSLSECTEIEPLDKLTNSVRDNRGFYIGRYEAGAPGTTEAIAVSANKVKDISGKVKPVSIKGVSPWNYIPLDQDGTLDKAYGDGAITVASSMYGINEDYGVVSTLVYASQWDEALKFIEKTDSTYSINSTGKGNYTGSLELTGVNTEFSVNNIYDMAGNVKEWTMEHYSSNAVDRGGSYYYSGILYPASYRYGGHDVVYSNDNVGFRAALYLK